MFITAEMIKTKYPCKNQFKAFIKLFPDGIDTDDPKSMKVLAKAGLDTEWLAVTFELTGKFECYHKNGERWYCNKYENGKPVKVQAWYKNGERWYCNEYKDNILVKSQAWYRDGERWYCNEYKDNILVKSQAWYRDGRYAEVVQRRE